MTDYKKLYEDLLAQVVILPADAEPEGGDVVDVHYCGQRYVGEVMKNQQVFAHDEIFFRDQYNDVRIIQRQGKPVIQEVPHE